LSQGGKANLESGGMFADTCSAEQSEKESSDERTLSRRGVCRSDPSGGGRTPFKANKAPRDGLEHLGYCAERMQKANGK